MRGQNTPTRRVVLANIGTVATGTLIPTAATAQERDPSDYDRPRTVIDNDVEFTLWDCSRVIVDTERSDVAEIWVQVEYIAEYWREELDRTTHSERLEIDYYGEELDINSHRRVPIEGAYAGADRLSRPIIRHVMAVNANEESLARVNWPQQEWDCFEMMEGTIGNI